MGQHPVVQAVPQQPSSAQHGFGQGIGQGSSQQPSSTQHGFGHSVVHGVLSQAVDSACAAIFGHDAVWAVIGQQAILADA